MSANQQGFPAHNLPIANPDGSVTQNWYQFFVSLWNRTGGPVGSQTFVTGDIKASAAQAAQEGWLACDGSAVSRAAYRGLFNTIGTAWGAGDGSTTFNLPDFRDRFPRGGSAVGSAGGASTVALSIANLAPHNHVVDDPGHAHAITDPGHGHTVTDPGHAHGYDAPVYDPVAGGGANSVSDNSAGATTDSATTGVTVQDHVTNITVNSALTGVTTEDTGSATPFSIIPPYAVVNYLIKT